MISRAKSLKTILAKHPFLAGLPDKYLDLLSGCAANTRFAEGEYLFHAGQPADRFYLLREGRAALELELHHRKHTVIQTLDEGEFLGWSWLIPPYHWHFAVRAAKPVLAFSFDGKCIRGKMEKDHELGFEMYRRFSMMMAKRLEEAFPQIVGLYR
ncbi:MAG: cyclic nucleotide-binding domain-containing protein [Elusimicrobiota bacterium]